MNDPYVVNVSSVQDFMQCRFRWLCKWVENRVPRAEPRPFRFGKLFHRLFEAHLGQGLPMVDALTRAKEEWIAEVQQKDPNSTDWADAVEDLEMMEEPLLQWKEKMPFDGPVLEVEQSYVFPFPGDPSIHIRMRPDSVRVRGKKIWHRQHKALAGNKNFLAFVELQERSYHEHIYAEGLVRKYLQGDHPELADVSYGGTDFNLYRKLKHRRKRTLKQIAAGEPGTILNPVENLFWQTPMTVDLSSPLHKHVIECLHKHIVDMRWVEEAYRMNGEVPAPNENMNGGYFGGKPDEYFYVLIGKAQLDNNLLFKDREDTYATPVAD